MQGWGQLALSSVCGNVCLAITPNPGVPLANPMGTCLHYLEV